MQTDLRNPITSWQEEERPREKLILKGKSSLSNKELLAILVGSGTPQTSAVGLSEQILHYVYHDLVQLGKLNINDLMRFKGMGEAKAIRVVASMELGRRRQAEDHPKVNIITSSKDIYILLLSDMSDLITEEFWVIFLNHRNKIIGKERISSGGLTATVVDVRILFKEAIERLATAIVIAHNHPSGTLKPSRADIQLTQKIKNASKLLDIQLLDHLIVADSGYYSFADDGCL